MNILFRADSSSTIGTGHIMRDLVLSKQYPNANIIFAAQELDGNINHKIKESGYEIKTLKNNDRDELDTLIKQLHINMLIIDNYNINAEYEEYIKKQNPQLTLMILDDTYEKHCCDILLNHNIYADARKYKNLVPKRCNLRCGSKYTLLRDEFIKEKAKKTYKSKEKKVRVFLSMGGADTQNLNPKILKVLKKSDNIKVDVVTTTANKNLKELKKYKKNKKWINLHVNTNKMAKLLRKSDFAIITPSVTANEVYFMQKPFIAIKTADNQKYMYKFLRQNGYLVMKRFSKTLLKRAIDAYK